jgi:hypothetical protein
MGAWAAGTTSKAGSAADAAPVLGVAAGGDDGAWPVDASTVAVAGAEAGTPVAGSCDGAETAPTGASGLTDAGAAGAGAVGAATVGAGAAGGLAAGCGGADGDGCASAGALTVCAGGAAAPTGAGAAAGSGEGAGSELGAGAVPRGGRRPSGST